MSDNRIDILFFEKFHEFVVKPSLLLVDWENFTNFSVDQWGDRIFFRGIKTRGKGESGVIFNKGGKGEIIDSHMILLPLNK